MRRVTISRAAAYDAARSAPRACVVAMRRALDRGVVHLAATRETRRRALGAVGRILWRFSLIRVRELPDPIIDRIVMREIRLLCAEPRLERPWVRDIVALAQGRPGLATAMGRFAAEWWRTHEYWPIPAFAFAAIREEVIIRSLRPVARGVHKPLCP